MTLDCGAFRRHLEALLAGPPDPPRLTALGWDEHLLSCGDCRDLLEQEEALELLLASLPDPKLPPDLARRVLGRLRGAADKELDALLALDRVEVPEGLSARVVAGLSARAEARLDALLELLGEEPPPAGLADRVLEGLRADLAAPRRRLRLVPGSAFGRVAAALLAALAVVGAWRLARTGEGGEDEVASVTGPPAPPGPAADEDIIALLPLLEYWDALGELDPLEQEIVTHLDVSDEALLDTEDS